MTTSSDLLERVFGNGKATKPEARARESSRIFIRSLDQIGEFEGRGSGRRLTAREAYEAYGLDVLAEVAREGSAVLCAGRSAAGDVLRYRREELGLDVREVANQSGVPPTIVHAAEGSARLPIRIYERIASSLGLDERYISVQAEPRGNEHLAVRLRTLRQGNPRLTPSAVAAIAEASWVAMHQLELEEKLGLRPAAHGIQPNSSYGSPDFVAHKWGYHLAREARQRLHLGEAPILSMRALAEERLGIPIIQTELGRTIAGLTVEVGKHHRAIVLNTAGENRYVYVRRSTIAHELGHLLYDPRNELNVLRVDEFDDLDARPDTIVDHVEQRANAFAVELIAPQDAALRKYRTEADGLAAVMHEFGISFTAARYQIWNALGRTQDLESITTKNRKPPAEWDASEEFTVAYHPLRVRSSRAGRFSALAVRAAEESIVSWDTAAAWLETEDAELKDARSAIRDLFPEVWPA